MISYRFYIVPHNPETAPVRSASLLDGIKYAPPDKSQWKEVRRVTDHYLDNTKDTFHLSGSRLRGLPPPFPAYHSLLDVDCKSCWLIVQSWEEGRTLRNTERFLLDDFQITAVSEESCTAVAKLVIQGETPLAGNTQPDPDIKYWAITGRLAGQDEDSGETFGPCTRADAIKAFTLNQVEGKNLTYIAERYGGKAEDPSSVVYINCVFSSASPIE